MIGTGRALFARRQKRGTNGSPGRPELHYKRKGWVAKKGQQKKREKKKRFSREKTINKSVVKRKKTLRENEYCFPVSCKSHYCTYSDSKRIKLCKF